MVSKGSINSLLSDYIIPCFSLAHIGGKEDLSLSKKTALKAVFSMSNSRPATTNDVVTVKLDKIAQYHPQRLGVSFSKSHKCICMKPFIMRACSMVQEPLLISSTFGDNLETNRNLLSLNLLEQTNLLAAGTAVSPDARELRCGSPVYHQIH